MKVFRSGARYWVSLLLASSLGLSLIAAEAEKATPRLPLFFEPGPTPEAEMFSARTANSLVRVQPTELNVVFESGTGAGAVRGRKANGKEDAKWRAVSIRFSGANPRARAVGAEKLSAEVNYLVGSDPAAWKTGLPLYSRVRVDQIYPGIDLEYYGNEAHVEHDFIVSPGADPALISFTVEGADSLGISPEDELVIRCGGDELKLLKPIAFQLMGDERRRVDCAYEIEGRSRVGFKLGTFDPDRPLVIDPVLVFSTYLGGFSGDAAWDLATDSAGNTYIVGNTLSSWLATPNAFRPFYSGGTGPGGGDGFVAKLDPTGSRLLFLTYLGGTGNDGIAAVSVDQSGSVYLAGVTDSTNFPVRAALKWFISGQPDPYGQGLYPYDAFVTKLSPSGSSLVYSTYLGGRGLDQATDIAIDSAGSAYVTGFTESGDFPRTVATNRLSGDSDAFIAKLTPDGSSLAYSRLLGGSSNERGQGIAVDGQGRAFLTGYTKSYNFPLTNAFQSTSAGGRDVYFTVLAANGNSLLQSTYLGGSGDDVGYRIALDAFGTAHITGAQAGGGFPVTPGNLNPGGVFRSDNAGIVWQEASAGLYHNEIQSLAVNPADPAVLYAGTLRGVARSGNGGASWESVLPGTAATTALAVDPFNPQTVYAGIAGLRKSTNAGLTWDTSQKGLPSGSRIYDIAPAPLSPGVLFAGTSAGLYKTTNAAANWRYSGSGMGSPVVYEVAISSANQSEMYVATSVGVYRSTNFGVSWFPVRQGMGAVTTRSVAIDPLDSSTLYAGTSSQLFKSVDAGSNWFRVPFVLYSTNVLTTNATVRALAISPTQAGTLYAGTSRGLFITADGGTNWLRLTNGLAVSNVAVLAFNPQNPAMLYAGTVGRYAFGGVDAFLVRLGQDLTSIVFGGGGTDTGWDVAVDAQGNSFVGGTTLSQYFPTNNLPTNSTPTALSGRNRGGYDGFVTAIDTSGSSYLYSGYLGGRGNDRIAGIAVDAQGNATVAGSTSSGNFPVVNAYRSSLAGGSDAFIARIQQILQE